MGRWSDPRSSTVAHLILFARLAVARVTSGELRPAVPLFTRVAEPSLTHVRFLLRMRSMIRSPMSSGGWWLSHSSEWPFR